MPPIPPQRALSTIVSAEGFRYRLKPADLLWAARMVAYEGSLEEAPAVLWATVGRFLWFADAGKRYRSFGDFLQEFSQPINPIWARDGEKCRPGGEYHGSSQFCSESQLRRRDQARTISWRNLPSSVTDLVARWGTGRVLNPVPTAANFADPSVAAHYLENHPHAKRVATYGNVYIAEGVGPGGQQDGGTKHWSDDYVGLENPDGTITAATVIEPSTLAALAQGLRSAFRIG